MAARVGRRSVRGIRESQARRDLIRATKHQAGWCRHACSSGTGKFSSYYLFFLLSPFFTDVHLLHPSCPTSLRTVLSPNSQKNSSNSIHKNNARLQVRKSACKSSLFISFIYFFLSMCFANSAHSRCAGRF
jgi:hypothetical protein